MPYILIMKQCLAHVLHSVYISPRRSSSMEAGQQDIIEVVVIDDEPISLLIIQKMIEGTGENIKVSSFSSARKGLEYIVDNEPCLVFTDLNMPDLSGWDILKTLNERDIERNLIVLTSSISPLDREQAMSDPNVKYFLEKPVSKAQLKECFADFDCLKG